jgi:transposase, IS5 family
MSMKQQTLAMAADQTFENYRKPTRRDDFLKTMEVIIAWSALCEVIGPHYPKAGNGHPPIDLLRFS